jgi:GTP-binding protein LepA
MTTPIYNFCIIAHIDHGKSTLADRLLELTGTVAARDMRAQLLDSMDLERERGITIKLQPVRMKYKEAILNLIDTPGHVDFQYEVSRSLQAVEGALLLVDATQGVQAQTISNLNLALEQGLTIIPIINKIDLPAADVERVEQEIISLVGKQATDILHISAKTGKGVDQVLEAIVNRLPVAMQQPERPLKALIFDSVYDDYKGVVAYVRIVEGKIKRGEDIVFMGTTAEDRVVDAGTFSPKWVPRDELVAGEIGYLATGLKDVRQARVGDTITTVAALKSAAGDKPEALAGFQIPQPKVFAGLFPVRGDQFVQLREAMAELVLSDASLFVQQERNEALGQGFRCGFLGMLHMEIVQERLKREHNLELVMTTPGVVYHLWLTNGEEREIASATEFPDPSSLARIEERYARVDILTPVSYMGPVFTLLQEREANLVKQDYLDADRVRIEYTMPLRELVVDLYDQLKSVTSGYGSMSYELIDWRPADVVKLDLMVNHEPVEALSMVVARSKAESLGRKMVEKMKQVVPKQLFAVPLQAAIGGKIVARETLPAMRKDVTGYLYGGDVTRKKKLLEKQKKGKKKMAGRGSVDIPPEAYLTLFKR